MVPSHRAAQGVETGLDTFTGEVLCLDSPEETAAVGWGTPSVAVPGPVKGHFLPRSAPRPLLFVPLSATAPASGKSGPGRISSADLRLLEPPASPDLAGHRTTRAEAPGRASRARGFLSDPLLPALLSRTLQPASSQPGFQRKEKASPPRRLQINRGTPGRAGRALGPRGLTEGGRGGAGEVFKLEPEPPLRGSGSHGAVERSCASPGRDLGVWRGVGPGGRFAQNVRGLPRRGAAAALSQVGAAQRARLGSRLSAPLLSGERGAWSGTSPCGRRSPPHNSPHPPPPSTSRWEPELTLPRPQVSQALISTHLSREGHGRCSHLTDGKTSPEKPALGRKTASQQQTRICIKVSYHPLTRARRGASHCTTSASLPTWGRAWGAPPFPKRLQARLLYGGKM